MNVRTRDGDEVVKNVFGASLYQQGRAFYVALEFLAMVRGEHVAGGPVLPPDDGQPVRYARRSHDFARRVLAGDQNVLGSNVTTEPGFKTLRALLRGLTVPVPGRRNAAAKWQAEHLYPYVGDLVHYDAVVRNGTVKVERYLYRGAGSLVHKIVRTDSNTTRLEETRAALLRLLADSDSALGRMARALAQHDEVAAEAAQPWTDDFELNHTDVRPSRWVEEMRSGLHRIVTRAQVPDSKRIEALMHWLPFCVAMHQLALARVECGQPESVIALDFRRGPNPVRQLAREAAREAKNTVFRALEMRARNEGKEHLLKVQAWRAGPRTFFTTTLAAIGAQSAKGESYFTMRTELVDALVLGVVDDEIDFERFCREILFDRLGFVVDADSANRAGMTARTDNAEFKTNSEALADFLRDLGILQDYSDATRMVRAKLW